VLDDEQPLDPDRRALHAAVPTLSGVLRTAALALLAVLALPAAAQAAAFGPAPQPGVTRPVILVGNNWDGTTDIVDPDTFERLDRVDVVPDKAERLAEITSSPVRLGFFIGIREAIGEGNDQFNDDVFSSNDGRTLFVSRPSFADVVAIDLATKRIKWRAPVDGFRSDHMAINAEGTRLLVSASTGNVVHELDTATGARVGQFPSGDSPHENVYSKDGKFVYHASIGRVYTPTDRPPYRDPTKGGEFFQIVDAKTNRVLKQYVMEEKLAEAGFPDLSGAVRPMALSPDEKFVYFQVSFFHGFVEFDLQQEKVTRLVKLPIAEEIATLPREQYLLDSAHHGLALDPEGEKFCVAGTMSDYGAIVSRRTGSARILDSGKKPYWSTNSLDGRHCYISSSQEDHVAVINYASEEIVHEIPVGRHPQRVRNGVVRVEQYKQGKHGEAFRLGTFTSRQPLTVRGGDENVGCRAERAERLRLVRCEVVLRHGGKVIGAGEAFGEDRRAVVVDVDLNAEGRKRLRRGRTLKATLVARGVDSVGRVDRQVRQVRLRRP
jgi:DNA-binding beta-propeller fold protein YncE